MAVLWATLGGALATRLYMDTVEAAAGRLQTASPPSSPSSPSSPSEAVRIIADRLGNSVTAASLVGVIAAFAASSSSSSFSSLSSFSLPAPFAAAASVLTRLLGQLLSWTSLFWGPFLAPLHCLFHWSLAAPAPAYTGAFVAMSAKTVLPGYPSLAAAAAAAALVQVVLFGGALSVSSPVLPAAC